VFSRVLVATLLVVALTSRAGARELDDATRSAARELASEGSALYESGSYEQAYDRFSRAYELVHVPTVGLWAARSLVKLGRFVEASERFLELARTPAAENAPAEHTKAKQDAVAEREALFSRIAALRVLVEGAAPNEVAVTLNGERLPTPLVGAKRPVNPGKLVVKATRGADAVEAAIELREGETRDVRLVFAPRAEPGALPPPAPAPVVTARPVASSAPESSVQRTLGWVALGIGGAGLAVGGVFGVLGLSEQSELDESCPDRECAPEHYAALDSYESKKTISTIGVVGGAAFALTGAVLLVTAPGDGARAQRSSTPRIGAAVGPNRIALFGAFE
jgi:hypothetical protein